MDDQWLLSFLRGCKFSLQRTKEKLDLFYTMKLLAPEFLNNKDPFQPEIQEFLEQGVYLPLPKTSYPAGPRLIIYRPGRVDPNRVSPVVFLKAFAMCADIHMHQDDNFIIGGQHILMDFRDVTFKHALQVTPSLIKKASVAFENAYCTRPQGLHLLNFPSFFITVHNILAPLLTEKLRNRIHFYTDKNFHTIYDLFPSSTLPREYGGEDSADKIAGDWKKTVESYENWFREDALYCSDETKRIGKPLTSA